MDEFWTKGRIARLVAYRRREPPVSFADIGDLIGCSKNAAIGKARRLAESGVEVPQKKPAPQSEKNRKSAERMRLCRERRAAGVEVPIDRPAKLVKPPPGPRMRVAPLFAPRPALPPAPAVTDPAMGIALLDLQPNSCRYPLGPKYEVSVRFCGVPTHTGSSYCGDHHQLCYVPARSSRPAVSPSPQATAEAR